MRFNGFTKVWESTKIGEIAEVVGGGTPKTEVEEYWNGEIKWFTPSEIGKTKYIFDSERHITNEGLKNSSAKLLPKNTILLSSRATVGEISIASTECSTNQGFQSLITKNNVDNEFIYYLITTIKNEFLRRSSGSTFLEISKNEIKRIPINIPELSEQNKISNLFSAIDNKIEMLEKKHQYYQDFKKYLMQRIFSSQEDKLRFNFNDTWKTVKIKDIFDERSEKGFLDLELLSVTLNDGVIKRSEIESKDNSNENKSNYKHVLPGDVVYNSMRMWQGASGVSPYEGIVSPAYTILIPKNVYSKYFGYYFKTNEMVYQFKKYSQGLTSDTWNLKYPLISEIKIKIPSIEEQKEITNVFEIMDEKIKILQNNIDELTTFKKGLLQQMFICWRNLMKKLMEFQIKLCK